jgi:hypothetical protein
LSYYPRRPSNRWRSIPSPDPFFVHPRKLIFAALVVVAAHVGRAADPVDAAAAGAAADYTERLKTATNDLLTARARIAAARTPLAEATRSAETRIAVLEG